MLTYKDIPDELKQVVTGNVASRYYERNFARVGLSGPTIPAPTFKPEFVTIQGQHLDSAGEWRLLRTIPKKIRGYWSPNQMVYDNIILQKRDQPDEENGGPWRTWMSCTPLERESQALAVKHARGHVLVMGFGLGVIAWNLAQKAEVEKVTVVDLDMTVVDLVDKAIDWQGNRHKVHVVHDDARAYKHPRSETIDLLYADIWPVIDDAATIPDIRHMYRNNPQARLVYYWTQEITAVRDDGMNGGHFPFKLQAWRRFVKRIGVPLLGADQEPEYVKMVNAAYLNVTIEYSIGSEAS